MWNWMRRLLTGRKVCRGCGQEVSKDEAINDLTCGGAYHERCWIKHKGEFQREALASALARAEPMGFVGEVHISQRRIRS
jgi:hypothetical protein